VRPGAHPFVGIMTKFGLACSTARRALPSAWRVSDPRRQLKGGGGAPQHHGRDVHRASHRHGGSLPAVLPTMTGRAWVTGRSAEVPDPTDPYPAGYTLAPRCVPDTVGVPLAAADTGLAVLDQPARPRPEVLQQRPHPQQQVLGMPAGVIHGRTTTTSVAPRQSFLPAQTRCARIARPNSALTRPHSPPKRRAQPPTSSAPSGRPVDCAWNLSINRP
jgi:hypothetical protein